MNRSKDTPNPTILQKAIKYFFIDPMIDSFKSGLKNGFMKEFKKGGLLQEIHELSKNFGNEICASINKGIKNGHKQIQYVIEQKCPDRNKHIHESGTFERMIELAKQQLPVPNYMLQQCTKCKRKYVTGYSETELEQLKKLGNNVGK